MQCSRYFIEYYLSGCVLAYKLGLSIGITLSCDHKFIISVNSEYYDCDVTLQVPEFSIFQSPRIVEVLLRLEEEINKGGLSIRSDRKLDADLG